MLTLLLPFRARLLPLGELPPRNRAERRAKGPRYPLCHAIHRRRGHP